MLLGSYIDSMWSLLNFGDFGVLKDGEIGCAFGFEMLCKF
jgi:hypothetical protein